MRDENIGDLEVHSDEFHSKGWRTADWKESPQTVLSSIDEQIRPFGLEVVEFYSQDDSYVWRVDWIAK